MTNHKHEVPLVWLDRQKRLMSLDDSFILPSLRCRFDNGGWCIWRKVDGKSWICIDGSMPNARQGAGANLAFAPLLDKAYEELITHKAIETIVLDTE